MATRHTPWTDKEVKLLKKRWDQNWSAHMIAEEFKEQGYNFTRNSVVGKLHRLGLKKTNEKNKDDPKTILTKVGLVTYRKARPKIARAAKAPVTPKVQRPERRKRSPMISPRPECRVFLTDTTEDHCRAIVGYVGTRAVCCGEQTTWSSYRGRDRKLPWCEFHRKLYLTEPSS